ncbi:hypothetical protein, partial [Collinsella aerofaciens]|uniref:hypothetical protein n=1 Tax=Collinsella aerofaciens TaxID=74426 RepID=UPI00359C7675
QPVGGQGAADRWTAPSRHRDEEGGGIAASPFLRFEPTKVIKHVQRNRLPPNQDVHRSLEGCLHSMDYY